MRIGIEAFKLFRKHKHGMDIVALELIQQLQRLDSYNEYFIFCFDDIDDTVMMDDVLLLRQRTVNEHDCGKPTVPYRYRTS